MAATTETPVDGARSLAIRSLMMIPAMLGTAILAGLVGWWLLGLRDLEGSEPMSEQGAYGWLVRIFTNGVILLAPAYAGLWWGSKARRLGAGTISLVAIGVNALAVAVVWVLIATSG